MPIVERSRRDCYERFAKAIRPVLQLVTNEHLRCPRRSDGDDTRRQLEFASGGTVPLNTNHGRLHFHFAQEVRTVEDGKKYRLETWSYWYRIQETNGTRDKAVIRWEYDKATLPHRHARHHMQIQGAAPLATGSSLDLNKLHLPTGWTTIEEVVRFLIHDLGVTPTDANWASVLHQSERVFHEEFR